jgi:hypothetical protein
MTTRTLTALLALSCFACGSAAPGDPIVTTVDPGPEPTVLPDSGTDPAPDAGAWDSGKTSDSGPADKELGPDSSRGDAGDVAPDAGVPDGAGQDAGPMYPPVTNDAGAKLCCVGVCLSVDAQGSCTHTATITDNVPCDIGGGEPSPPYTAGVTYCTTDPSAFSAGQCALRLDGERLATTGGTAPCQ